MQNITQIRNNLNEWKYDSEEIVGVFVNYYSELLGKKAQFRKKTVQGIMQKGPTILVEQQLDILRNFNHEDVKKAMFNIGKNKSPGPDGYSSGFYKKTWCIVGQDISEVVLDFFRNGRLLKQINSTVIALIPKVEKPEYARQFRLISYCNVLYKYISKMICHRLKPIVENLVPDNQSAFVQDRSMVHNILICHDLLRHYNKKTSARCMMKIDLRKAYDIVSWEFLEEVMLGYRFPMKFVNAVMTCVTSTKFSVRVNGECNRYFKGKRGLRQGDHMSPLLFVLVMEYLSRTLKTMSNLNDFKLHPMCKTTRLTHLIFADDLMMFCKGNIKVVSRVMEALSHFSEVTGLEANMEKSNIFIAGVDESTKDSIL